MTRIVLADDHPIVIEGLCRYFALQKDLRVLTTVKDGGGLVAAIETEKPDVVVMDLNMPGMDGAHTIRAIVEKVGAPAVVVFSMQEEDTYAASLVHVGAAAYLNKSRSPEELAGAIRAAANGERYLTDAIAAHMQTKAPHEAFSKRERQVFDRLLEEQTPKEIAFALGLAQSTVHTYSERIREKLGVDNIQGLIAYAFKHRLRR